MRLSARLFAPLLAVVAFAAPAVVPAANAAQVPNAVLLTHTGGDNFVNATPVLNTLGAIMVAPRQPVLIASLATAPTFAFRDLTHNVTLSTPLLTTGQYLILAPVTAGNYKLALAASPIASGTPVLVDVIVL